MFNQHTGSNPDSSLLHSASSSALLSRLKPKNDNINKPVAQTTSLNTLKPKAAKSIDYSQSAPNFSEGNGTHETHKPKSDGKHSQTLSNSSSAAFLSSNPTVRKTYLDTRGSINDKDHNRADNAGKSYAEEFKDLDINNNDADVAQDHDNGKITVQRNSFISSLNLSQKQLFDLFKVPQTFFYLRIKMNHSGSGESSSGSVYDLELVPLDQLDKNSYFTLSKEGVTQFRNKVSSFTGLAQWEREYRLFHKIAEINFFKVYKRWKVSSREFCARWFCDSIFGVSSRHLLYGEKICVMAK